MLQNSRIYAVAICLTAFAASSAQAASCGADVTAAYRAMALKEYDAVLGRQQAVLGGKTGSKAFCSAHRAVVKEDRALANLTGKYNCLPTDAGHWNKKAGEAEAIMRSAGCR